MADCVAEFETIIHRPIIWWTLVLPPKAPNKKYPPNIRRFSVLSSKDGFGIGTSALKNGAILRMRI